MDDVGAMGQLRDQALRRRQALHSDRDPPALLFLVVALHDCMSLSFSFSNSTLLSLFLFTMHVPVPPILLLVPVYEIYTPRISAAITRTLKPTSFTAVRDFWLDLKCVTDKVDILVCATVL